MLVERITVSAAETRSFHRAAIVMGQVAGQAVSAKTIQRVVGDVGGELADRRDANPKTADALAERPERPPGERGEVRLVLEIGDNGQLHPLGVWTGASWEEGPAARSLAGCLPLRLITARIDYHHGNESQPHDKPGCDTPPNTKPWENR